MKKGKKIVKAYGQLRNIYWNNYGVRAWLLEDDTIYMKIYKRGRAVRRFWTTCSRHEFERKFLREDMSDIDLVASAVDYIKEGTWERENCTTLWC